MERSNPKNVKLEDIIRKSPHIELSPWPAAIVGQKIALQLLRGYRKVDVRSVNGVDGETYEFNGFLSSMTKNEPIDRKEYLKSMYSGIKNNAMRRIFIYACRFVVKQYSSYENTPSWFRDALSDLNIA